MFKDTTVNIINLITSIIWHVLALKRASGIVHVPQRAAVVAMMLLYIVKVMYMYNE